MAKGVKIFGKKLAAARNRLYLTQADLGEKLGGMSDENIGRIERSDVGGIAKSRIPKLAEVLGMTLAQFEHDFVVKEGEGKGQSIVIPPDLVESLKSYRDKGVSLADLAVSILRTWLRDQATSRVSAPAASGPETEGERSDFVDVVEDREGEKSVTSVKVGGSPTPKVPSAAQRAKSARRHQPRKNPKAGSPQPQSRA